MSKIVDESILVFSTIFLTKILSRNSLHFMDIRVFIVVYVRNMKSHFLQNRAFWRLSLASGMSRKLTVKPDYQFLSCSAPTIVTLQLPACFTRVAFW